MPKEKKLALMISLVVLLVSSVAWPSHVEHALVPTPDQEAYHSEDCFHTKMLIFYISTDEDPDPEYVTWFDFHRYAPLRIDTVDTFIFFDGGYVDTGVTAYPLGTIEWAEAGGLHVELHTDEFDVSAHGTYRTGYFLDIHDKLLEYRIEAYVRPQPEGVIFYNDGIPSGTPWGGEGAGYDIFRLQVPQISFSYKGETIELESASAMFDHIWGDAVFLPGVPPYGHWDWFNVQLDNGRGGQFAQVAYDGEFPDGASMMPTGALNLHGKYYVWRQGELHISYLEDYIEYDEVKERNYATGWRIYGENSYGDLIDLELIGYAENPRTQVPVSPGEQAVWNLLTDVEGIVVDGKTGRTHEITGSCLTEHLSYWDFIAAGYTEFP